MDSSQPGSSVHGIFQARILEWVAISFSRGSSRPRDRTWVSLIVGRCFTVWATREVTSYACLKHPNSIWLLRIKSRLLIMVFKVLHKLTVAYLSISSSTTPPLDLSTLTSWPPWCSSNMLNSPLKPSRVAFIFLVEENAWSMNTDIWFICYCSHCMSTNWLSDVYIDLSWVWLWESSPWAKTEFLSPPS